MNWYQVLTAIASHTGPVVDLSTGSPLLVEEIVHKVSLHSPLNQQLSEKEGKDRSGFNWPFLPVPDQVLCVPGSLWWSEES